MRNLLLVLAVAVLGCSSDDTNNGAIDLGTDAASTPDSGGVVVDMHLPDAGPDIPATDDLTEVLSPRVDDGTMPSLTVVVLENNAIIAAGAVGLRKLGTPSEVSTNDKHSLASVSKPFTATLAGVLVDRGVINWDTTVEEAFGFADMDPAFAGLTLVDFLTHQAGLRPGIFSTVEFETQGNRAARLEYTRELLSNPPQNQVGRHIYTNNSLVVAATMLETMADEDWESMMQLEIFDALGLESCGFGWPDGALQELQPWPHGLLGGAPSPRPSSEDWDGYDLPYAPAAGIHCSMPDLARFGAVYLGDQDLLSSDSLAYLLEPKVGPALDPIHPVMLGGRHTGAWMTVDSGTVFHSGVFNDSNFAHLHISPADGRVVAAATNIESDASNRAFAEVVQQIEDDYF